MELPDGYDEQKKDYYYERHGKRQYRRPILASGKKPPRKQVMETAQINNLLGVALETSSPTVVVNWARYQMGRKETRQAWAETGFGEQVIGQIERIGQQIAGQVAQEAFGDSAPEHLQQAHIALIRLYVGYLKRWFVAKGGQG